MSSWKSVQELETSQSGSLNKPNASPPSKWTLEMDPRMAAELMKRAQSECHSPSQTSSATSSKARSPSSTSASPTLPTKSPPFSPLNFSPADSSPVSASSCSNANSPSASLQTKHGALVASICKRPALLECEQGQLQALAEGRIECDEDRAEGSDPPPPAKFEEFDGLGRVVSRRCMGT
ncbi:hypothetical protein V5O48_010157 [Marasmius crinis-equi]|uniref:Uncharacterized protein n=1 Tax=Marasmius crinis-equi TaxID=585013 RepID=A0ABR3F9N7_9AGAR